MTEQSADVSEIPFFRHESTLESLRKLAGARNLVIYCGAGVSVDRTGVTWPALVEGIYKIARAVRTTKLVESKSVEYLLANLDNPKQSSSILVESFASGQTENEFLTPKLHDILYTKHGWSRGYMLRNLIQLSMSAAATGRNVVIITTNYDSYIEEEFQDRHSALVDAGAIADSLPGLRRRVLSGDNTAHVEICAQGKDAGCVEIIYLHGRVDRHNAPTEGEIVLTESSYALSHNRSAQILTQCFSGESKGVLVVGASLTDEPLIQALALSKNASNLRYALVATPSALVDLSNFSSLDTSTEISPRTVGQSYELRGRHLGICLLRPMNHSQSAQYLEELRIAVGSSDITGDGNYYSTDKNRANYAQRLEQWHDSWSKRADTKNPWSAYSVLQKGLEEGIRLALKKQDSAAELFRVEIWVRKEPRSHNRNMTLWATSTGPIIDRSTLRSDPIRRDSTNASIRALMDGRPRLLSIEELGLPAHASRWQTFLSMPIFVQVEITNEEFGTSSYIPAGVITLTSNMSMTNANSRGEKSVFSDSLEVEDFNIVKAQLIAMGRTILRPSDEPDSN